MTFNAHTDDAATKEDTLEEVRRLAVESLLGSEKIHTQAGGFHAAHEHSEIAVPHDTYVDSLELDSANHPSAPWEAVATAQQEAQDSANSLPEEEEEEDDEIDQGRSPDDQVVQGSGSGDDEETELKKAAKRLAEELEDNQGGGDDDDDSGDGDDVGEDVAEGAGLDWQENPLYDELGDDGAGIDSGEEESDSEEKSDSEEESEEAELSWQDNDAYAVDMPGVPSDGAGYEADGSDQEAGDGVDGDDSDSDDDQERDILDIGEDNDGIEGDDEHGMMGCRANAAQALKDYLDEQDRIDTDELEEYLPSSSSCDDEEEELDGEEQGLEEEIVVAAQPQAVAVCYVERVPQRQPIASYRAQEAAARVLADSVAQNFQERFLPQAREQRALLERAPLAEGFAALHAERTALRPTQAAKG